MYLKIRGEKLSAWFIVEFERIHYYNISWEEFANVCTPENAQNPSWDVSIRRYVTNRSLSEIEYKMEVCNWADFNRIPVGLDHKVHFIRAILHTKEGKEIVVQFDSMAYLCDETGRTVETIVASDLPAIIANNLS